MLLDIEGMHCASCVSRVEHALAAVPHVVSVRVNLATNQAAVTFEPDQTEVSQLLEAVSDAGYRASRSAVESLAAESLEARAQAEQWQWLVRFAVATAGLLLLLGTAKWLPAGDSRGAWLQLVIASGVQLFVGGPYYLGAWRRLRRFSSSMDTLIALGTSAAYLSGVVGFFSQADLMTFQDASMILAFITLGKYLEVRTKGRASRAIRRLLQLAPAEATVLRGEGPVRVPLAAVARGETLLIRPGDRVPLDAEVTSGQTTMDEAWLTGESMPVDKGVGDRILAGSINGSSSLEARVLHGMGATALDRVIQLVRHAQESKADAQQLADRVVAWFVPGVLVIAAVTLVGWAFLARDPQAGLRCAVAVLIVACPCALGLATPTAVMVASGRGAESGILIKDAAALEAAARIDGVLLDKTGTLTTGRPQVLRVRPVASTQVPEPLAPPDAMQETPSDSARIKQPDSTPEEQPVSEALRPPGDLVTDSNRAARSLLAVAAGAEQLSNHPLARAIVEHARRERIEIPVAERLEVYPGVGIEAICNGQRVLIGNAKLLSARGIALLEVEHRGTASKMGDGTTEIWVAVDGRVRGTIQLADTVEPASIAAVQAIRRLVPRIAIVTGDTRATAESVARTIGIQEVFADLRPEQKLDVIRGWQGEGLTVAMVGDGINDAPALAAADVGIAIGTGADVAIETADLVLVRSDLAAVPRAIRLAQQTLRTIRQNLVWAFLYNLLLIPLAAGVFSRFGVQLEPHWAAAAMAISSVSVVTNSLLLRSKSL